MGREREYFFMEGHLSSTLENRAGTIAEEVDAIPRDQFLATPVDDIVAHIAEGLRVEPLAVFPDSMTREQTETKIDLSLHGRFAKGYEPLLVPGIKVIISLPFTGDPSLWGMQPSRYTTDFPRGAIRENCVEMTYAVASDDNLQKLKSYLDENIRLIHQYIEWQRPTVEKYNECLAIRVRTAVEARRRDLQKHEQLAEILGIPLARDPRAPEMKPIQLERRIIKPLPPPPTGGYRPEWGIPETEYENILTIIRHEGRTFEATPKTFAVHDEEEMRDIILAHLNGHYKGDASGETFRRNGQTDIRIEMEDRAAFVAECKIWRGPKSITEAVDQLLSYLTWRDCRAAIVVFNKEVAGFTELLEKTGPTLEEHCRFMKFLPTEGPGEWRCVFRSKDDEARLVHVHVFLFNLYV